MIQATGTIVGSNGIAKYTNPLINVNYNGSDKHIGVIVTAEVGEEKTKPSFHYENEKRIETTKIYWEKVDSIQSFTTKDRNPDFDKLQGDMLEQLRQTYPEVQFEIV